jgi:phosphonate transport system substrate-binding protein
MHRFHHRIFLAAVLTFVLPAISVANQPLAETETYTFGIVPQQSASRLARDWGPLLRHLSQTSGVNLTFKTAPNIPEFERRLAKGEYDFAYMNPYHYTVFSDSPGYRAFSKVSNKTIKGIFVVREDSKISTLQDLSGTRLAFPSPAAFAATVLPRSELHHRAIEYEPTYVNSHDSVYRGVAMGLFPAGGGIMRTLNVLDPNIRSQLRILWTSKGYTPHAFAVHPRVPGDAVKRVAKAMYELNTSDTGRKTLANLGMKELEPANDSDWNDVRELSLQELKSPTQNLK